MFGIYDVDRYILAVPINNENWDIPFFVNINNVGEKFAEELEITYRINNKFLLVGKEAQFSSPGLKNAKVVDIQESGAFSTLFISMSNLHPKQELKIKASAGIRSPTFFKMNIDANTSDDVELTVTTWLNTSIPIDLVVSQKETGPTGRRFEVQVIEASQEQIRDFFKEYNEVITKKENGQEKEKAQGRFDFKKYFKAPKAVEKIALIYFDETKRVVRTARAQGKKVLVNEVPVESMLGTYGYESSDGYHFPYFEKGS